MKTFAKSFIAALFVFTLAACGAEDTSNESNSTSSETSTTSTAAESVKTYVYEEEKMSVTLTLEAKPNTDILLKQEAITRYKNLTAEELQNVIEQVEAYQVKNQGVAGVEITGNKLSDSEYERIVRIDFTKLGVQKAVEQNIVSQDTLSGDKRAVSLEKTELAVKDLGFTEEK
ncbi:MAG: DUF1307 domain-containing protein [Arcanobacterium sp.]|nr:DUF1307 domain-containing protein [Arcanobacterium sp.]